MTKTPSSPPVRRRADDGAGVTRILGVDPGTLRCGYGVIETGGRSTKPRYLECGVFELDGQKPLADRLALLARDLREVLGEFQPDELALESAFHGVNAQSALRLGHARGVIMLLGAEAGLPLGEYAPASVKRSVCGHGRAAKEEVQRVVSWVFGLRRVPQADAADALAIALCHAYHRGVPAVLRSAKSRSASVRS